MVRTFEMWMILRGVENAWMRIKENGEDIFIKESVAK